MDVRATAVPPFVPPVLDVAAARGTPASRPAVWWRAFRDGPAIRFAAVAFRPVCQ